MKLTPISANCNEVTVNEGKSTEIIVLFSYRTPVAARTPQGNFKTEVKHSVTTSKHINQWGGKTWETKPQAWFDEVTA